MTQDEYDRLLEVMNAKVKELTKEYALFWINSDTDVTLTLDGDFTPAQLRQLAEWLEHAIAQQPL